MKEIMQKLIETMALSGQVTGEDLLFAFQTGIRCGRLEILEEQVKK